MVKTASVIGLGKLGAPLVACLASKGVNVTGADVDPRKVAAVAEGRAPVFETGLEAMMLENRERIRATSSIEEAVAATEITFIVVGTPSEDDGSFSLGYVLPVCELIGHALRTKSNFHLVVLTSTVMPGTTGGPVKKQLEDASGKTCGRDFGLCYSPEFIALGSVIRDFLNPDFVLIGESDPRSGAILEEIYSRVCDSRPGVARMNFVNAEITKLAVNTYITTKISFANMLARICERLPGGDVDVVTTALGLDTRIGAKYLKGAVSYGGPCFPRDNHALAALALEIGAPADLAQAIDTFNRTQVEWLAAAIENEGPPGSRIGILGLTYKPQTDVVEQAVGLLLADVLAERNFRVVAFDPEGMTNAQRVLGDRVDFAATAEECIGQSDVVVVATPWKEFGKIPADAWRAPIGARVIIDCWRGLKHLENAEGVRYVSLGLGASIDPIPSAK